MEKLVRMSSLAWPGAPALTSCKTLVQLLRARAGLHPDRLAYTFLPDGESTEENLTFAALDQRARVVAEELRRWDLPGSRALIVYEPSLDYLVALFGCFYAQVTAVPVYPPDPMRALRTMERLQTILNDAQAAVMLTTSSLRHWTDSLASAGGPLQRVLATDTLDYSRDPEWNDPGIERDAVALLQYTSGSTTTPRGCVITHGNLLCHFQHIQQFDEPDAVAVSWLPMYHDMGLIGLALQTAHGGRRLVFMSPLSFVQRPFRWLQAISKYRAYATASPNFGFELCVRKISEEEIDELDLSCLTLACNGAEPIRHETLERFVHRFRRCGLRPEALYPCYGLAEATLMVSGGGKYEPPVLREFTASELSAGRAAPAHNGKLAKRTLVGCGRPVHGTTVRIVDFETHRVCPERRIGEIWVRGPGVAQGYWNRPRQSDEVFAAFTRDSQEGPFLRTGDLGFLDGGELFVVGRRKDVIILHGKNHYPQDIETTMAHCHRALRRDCGAAFSIDVHEVERLVVVHEVVRPKTTDLEELIATLRAEISREHGVFPHAIVLIRGGTLPKTSSGKIQRSECRDQFLRGGLEVVKEWREANGHARPLVLGGEQLAASRLPAHANGRPTRDELLATVRHFLHELVPQASAQITGETRLFGDLGMASIDALALQGLVEDHYRRKFPFDEFMAEIGRRQARDASVAEFVSFLDRGFAEDRLAGAAAKN